MRRVLQRDLFYNYLSFNFLRFGEGMKIKTKETFEEVEGSSRAR